MTKKVVLFLIVILIICFVIFLFFNNKEKQKQVELPPVFSIVGEITNITEKGFQVKTLKEQNSFGVDKDFIILIATSTSFSKIEIPQTISQEDANTPILAQKSNFSGFKVKDNVVVESDVNLRNISQFTAKSMQILEYAK